MSGTPPYAGWAGDFNRNTENEDSPATRCHRNLIKGCWAHVQKIPNLIEQMYHFPDVSAAAVLDSEGQLRSDHHCQSFTEEAPHLH